MPTGSDVQVQGTNDDAQVSKLSCAKGGYFKDEYIQYFVRRASKRSPLINRGYYSRYAALRQLLLNFLSCTKAAGLPSQVLVLGAGFDTTWFQLAAEGQQPDRYLEVDFKEVTARKVGIIKQQPTLLNLVQTVNSQAAAAAAGDAGAGAQQGAGSGGQGDAAATAGSAEAQGGSSGQAAGSGGMPPPPVPARAGGDGAGSAAQAGGGVHIEPTAGELVSNCYTVLPVDLRDPVAFAAAVQRAGFDTSLPTYILSECVLVYMEPEHSSAVVRWLAGHFKQAAAIAIYEQVKPGDAFGRQMVANLESRGCPLRGLPATPTLDAHCRRLVDNGWGSAKSYDMDHLYKHALDPADRARVEKLEVFDEFEEWHMIQEHYSISVGTNSAGGGRCPPGLLSSLGFNAPGASLDAAARN